MIEDLSKNKELRKFSSLFEFDDHHTFKEVVPDEAMLKLATQKLAYEEGGQSVEDDDDISPPTKRSRSIRAKKDKPVALTIAERYTLTALERAFNRDMEKLSDARREYVDQYPNAWWVIMDSLDPEFKSHITGKKDYTHELNGNKDPLILVHLITSCYHALDIGKSKTEVMVELTELYVSSKQKDGESIQDYLNRFVRDLAMFKAHDVHIGDEAAQSYIFFRGLDETRHGKFKEHIKHMKLTQPDSSHIPKTCADICDIARSFSVGCNAASVEIDTATAYIATSQNHVKKRGPREKSHRREDTSEEYRPRPKYPCSLCQSADHVTHKCPDLELAKTLMANNKQQAAHVAIHHAKVRSETGPVRSSVIYDTGATLSLFGNKDLRNLRSTTPVTFQGLNGIVESDEVGDFGFVRDVYYSPEVDANLISCSQAGAAGITRGRVNDLDAYYLEHDGERLFFYPENNLYIHHPPERILLTVADMESKFSKADIAKARFARSLSQRMGVPCDKDAYSLIVHTSAGGYHGVTPKHFDIAEQLWGKRIAALAGKSTEPDNIKVKLEPVFSFAKPVVTVHLDIFFVAKIPFLVAVVKPIGLILTNCLGTRAARPITQALIHQLLTLHKHHYTVQSIIADGEHGIHKYMDDVAKAGIRTVEVVSTHVPEVENVVKTIKSWARGTLVELPFKLPHFLIQDLITFTVQRLNMFSSKRGYNGLSAIEALTGQKVDLNNEVRAAFGDYCQVTTPNLGLNKSNVLVPRTEPAIALANKGRSGAVNFYSLNTGKRITRTKFAILPTPEDVIAKMNKAAAERFVNADDIITAEEANADAQLNTLHVHDEAVHNDFEFLHNDPHYAELMRDDEGPGEHEPAIQQPDAVASDVHQEHSVAEPSFEPELVKRYNTRGVTRDYRNIERIFNITVKKALNEYPVAAVKAIAEELLQLVRKDCFDPVTDRQLTPTRRRKLIRSFMFLKMKNKPDGTFDKLKARLVANGSQQDFTTEQRIANSSPTASLASILMIAAIAAKERREVVTVDVKSAYINARMPEDDVVDILIEPSIATELVKLAPDFSSTLRRDGSMVVNLKGALYGTQQAAKLWYLDISKYLISLGFVTNDKDSCVFNLKTDDTQLTAVLYVDDLKLTCIDVQKIDWLLGKLEDKYEEITINRGTVHHYLGMTFDYTNGLSVSMAKYEADLVEDIKKSVSTPALDDLY
jgi:hypothetical protein